MDKYVTLKWKYSPNDFFEEKISVGHQNYLIELDNGEISVNIPALFYDEDKMIIEEITSRIEGIFAGAQVISQVPYDIQLSNYTTFTDRENGTQNITLSVSSLSSSATVDNVDLQLTDSEGKILSDTRIERNNERKRFISLAGKFREKDEIVKSILNSFNASINEKHHSLSHLYDIYEALIRKFGNEKELRKNLGISERRIRRLRILSNKEPLIEGRHVGYHAENLRNAKDREIEEARNIAKELIYSYLTFLEAQDLFIKK